ncbi:MAG: aspartate aminotransferase, partial [Flavobacteriales bacterium]
FYIFPDASSYFGKSDGTSVINNVTELCNYLLEKEHIALVTGEAFGDPNCFRISYAASEAELKEAINRIKRALDQLK